MRLSLVTMLLATMVAACAGNYAAWSPVGGTQVIENEPIQVEWPQGWMEFIPAPADEQAQKEGWVLTTTRDGVGLQAITLKKRPIAQGFTYTQKKAFSGSSPQDLAELVLDDMRANPIFNDIHVLDNSPTALDGVPGYKLVIRYQTKTGLPKEAVHYGCIQNDILYMLSYDAPQRHYYALDLPRFEAVKNSLKWTTRQAASP